MIYDRKSLRKCASSREVIGPKRGRGRPKSVTYPLKSRVISNALSERLSEAVAAAWFCVALDKMRATSRSAQPVASARQVGMYFAHVVFSANLTRAGRVFGRDRTTARNACAAVEERRERASLDVALDRLEPSLRVWASAFAKMALRDEGDAG